VIESRREAMTPTIPEKVAVVQENQKVLKVTIRDLVKDNRRTQNLVKKSHRRIMAALLECKNSRPCMIPKPAAPAPADTLPRAWFEFLGKVLAGAVLVGSVAFGAWQEYRKDSTRPPAVTAPQQLPTKGD
jgi:hypothetical protein